MRNRTVTATIILLISLFCFHALGEEVMCFEAENGHFSGKTGTGSENGITFVTGFAQDDDSVEIPVTVNKSGFYDIVFNLRSQDGGYKENYVLADGENVGTVKAEGKQWQKQSVEYVYLAAGEHSITVRKFWGWIQIDSLQMIPSTPLPDDLYEIEPLLVNPDASGEARSLMTYLCSIYGKAVLSGQYCDEGMYGAENATIWRATGGKYPAMLGLDLIEYSPSRVAHGAKGKTVDLALDYWDKGGIVTFCWHWNAPEKYITGPWYSAFYTDSCNLDLAAVMDGRDPEGYELLMEDIDAIAAQLLRLKEAGVPVLWRPLHEASGGWFWWGAAGHEAYLKLYRLLYDRLTNEYGLNNLIWVWNGQDADWYPGDEYVDIIGEDIYPGEQVYTSQAARFIKAMRYTDAKKMITLSENGCLPDPELLFRDGIVWSYTGTWGGEFVMKNKTYNILSEQYTDEQMLRKFYTSDLVITRDELPDLKNGVGLNKE